jgi:hypothetical protein
MSEKIPMMRKVLMLALGGLGLLGAGCGQTSYFSVDVIVSGQTGRDPLKMQQVIHADVKAEGAISDQSQFGLEGFPRPSSYGYPRDSKSQIIIGTFQYGTTSESGNVTFHVTLRDDNNDLATGSGDGTIHSGSSVAMSVTVDPTSAWQ